MAEKKSTDSISISPEILHTLPMELKHGDPIYCTIPKLGWIKGRIGTQPKTQLSMFSKNGTTYQFIDLSAAPIAGMPTSGNQKAGDFFHFGGSFNKKAGGRR